MTTNRRKFIRYMGSTVAGLGLVYVIPGCNSPSTPANVVEGQLPRSTPEAQGVDSMGLVDFLKAVVESGQEWHSFMIVRHGHVIAEAWWEPYRADIKQQLYSLSKSFTSTAIGLAQSEGLLTVEDTVTSFFPDELPDQIDNHLSALKVKHLLTMSVGHDKDAIRLIEKSTEVSWAEKFLSLPVEFEPGTHFLYNSGASYMLSAIITKVTGLSAHEYLKPRLFDPLSIEGSTWTENDQGVNIGASHLRVKTEDLAKFGQLYLQNGQWEGQEILPASWVKEASKKQISTGDNNHSWGFGYGYQFWLNPPGGFRADGAFGQYSMIFPQEDAVVVITSESTDKAKTMQVVWDQLVPLLNSQKALSNQSDNYELLNQKLGSRSYLPPVMNESSPLADTFSGKIYTLDPNEHEVDRLSFKISENEVILSIEDKQNEEIKIHCGINKWITEGNFKPRPNSLFSTLRIDFDSEIAASATWQDDHVLIITWRTIETCHSDRLTCNFTGNEIEINFMSSVAIIEQDKIDPRQPIKGQVI